MVLSTLSPNVWAMMIIYGIFGGIFFGMVYLPYVNRKNKSLMIFFCCYLDQWSWSPSISTRNETSPMVKCPIADDGENSVRILLFFLGLVTAGTGIGALSFGPLATWVMSALGWRKGMLVFAAIMLTGVLFGAIMKPLKPQKRPIQKDIEMEYARFRPFPSVILVSSLLVHQSNRSRALENIQHPPVAKHQIRVK